MAQADSAEMTILIPSKGRPKNFGPFVENWREFTSPKTQLCFITNTDQPRDYIAAQAVAGNGVYVLDVPPGQRGMVYSLNTAFRLSNFKDGFAVGFMGDDHRPRTKNWDLRYLEALKELGSGFVYGNDLFQGERMPTQVAMTSDIPRTLGWMCPPEFRHLCVDLVWKDQGDGLGRIKYLPDVIVEHMHPLAGKSRNDKNYAIVNNSVIANHDAAAYAAYKDVYLARDVAFLKEELSLD